MWSSVLVCILIFILVYMCMQVAANKQGAGVESKQQAIIKVMVDLLLDTEGITASQGLIYVLDELESYPVSGIERHAAVGIVYTLVPRPVWLSFSWSSWLLSC